MTDFADLKSRVDLLTEIEKDLGPGKQSGRWVLFSCPFPGHAHGDRNPSLSVTGDNQRYYCFSCEASGDLITWLHEYRKMDWKQIRELAGSNNLPQPIPRPAPLPVESKGPPPQEWQEKARRLIDQAAKNLYTPAGYGALEYLYKRGLNDATIKRYQLGYNVQEKRESRDLWGLEEDPIGKDVWIPKGITIPCFEDAVLWSVKVRLFGHGFKYINIANDQRTGLFGSSNLLGADIVLLTEGEFDCMLADQLLGDVCGVATLGSSSKGLDSAAWGKYFLPARVILAAYDLDQPGEKGIDRLRHSLYIHQLKIPRLRPGDKDITDYYLAGGDLWEWLKYNLDRLGVLEKQYRIATPGELSPGQWLHA